MNWPLWKRELRGRSWWRLGGTLAAIVFSIVLVQLLRAQSDIGGTPSDNPFYCVGLFGIDTALGLIANAPYNSAVMQVFRSYADVRWPFIGASTLGLIVALVVAHSLRRMDRREAEALSLTPIRSRDLAIAACLRPFVFLAVGLVVFGLTDTALWRRFWWSQPFSITGHSFVIARESTTSGETSAVVDEILLARHGWLGLSAEIAVRLAFMVLLMVTASLTVMTHLRRPLGVAVLLAALLATTLGQVPEITRYASLQIFPPPGATAPVPPTASGRPRASYRESAVAYGFTLGTSEPGVVARIRQASVQEDPDHLTEYIREWHRRGRHEEVIIWLSYLVPTALWLLLWLSWAKRFFLRSFLRE